MVKRYSQILMLGLIIFTFGCTKQNELPSAGVETEAEPEATAETTEVPEKSLNLKAVRRTVKQFSQAKDDSTRYQSAMAVFALGAPTDALKKEKKLQGSWQEAYAFAQRVRQAVENFESGLASEQVEFLVQDNENALARRTGKFDTFAFQEGCRKEEFERVRDSMGSAFVASRLRSFLELADLYESGYQASYATRAMQLIKSEDQFAPVRNELILYYNEMRKEGLEEERARDKRVSRRGQIWRTKELLKDTGITGVPREERLAKYAQMAPSCFGRMDSKVRTWINEAVTKSRGAYLLDRLKQRAWEELTGDDLIVGDPIKGDTVDAWGKAYLQEPDEQRLRSAGPDTEFSTSDDIIISDQL